jgi:Flp pilus assembly protein TadD
MKGARIATSLLCGLLSLAAVCVAQDAAAKGGMAASLDAAITSSGALQGTLVISAFGAPSLPFRESFVQNATRRLSPSLLGRFTRDREAHATPLVIDAGNQERAIKIQFQIREDDFILPIQRQAPLQLDLVTLISPITTQPDGNLHLGSPGTFREQISVEIPTDFTVEADAHLNNENSFARYQSDSKAIAGKLVIVRELQLKQETVAASQRADVDSFRKMIADDQRRAFVLRRIKHADLTEWIQSVPADKTKSYGLRAYQQREYEAARQLFERATRANPNDPDAWNSLGLAFAALARWEDAQMAYEKQIAINPKGAYGYNNLGVLQERGGFWEMAIESFKKQIEIRPGDPNAIANLPGVLMQAARWAEAEDAAAKALQLRPKTYSNN